MQAEITSEYPCQNEEV